MLVKYEVKQHKPKSSKRPSATPLIEMNFDPYKLLTKVNNHKKPSTPNFGLMSSRPEGQVLPSYMQVSTNSYFFYLKLIQTFDFYL